MIGFVLAAALAQAPQMIPRSGNWVIIDVQNVIAPEQLQGQCFVVGKVSQVVRGSLFKEGQQLNITLACAKGPPRNLIPLQASPNATPPPITVQRLETLKRALVHLNRSGQVVNNDYYAVGPEALSPR